jgi:hypothetical protein
MSVISPKTAVNADIFVRPVRADNGFMRRRELRSGGVKAGELQWLRECSELRLAQFGECGVKLAFSARIESMNLLADRASRVLHTGQTVIQLL